MGRFLDDRLARPPWRRYSAAVAVVAVASLLSVVLHSWLQPAPLAPYFTAVAIAAWYGGVGPAVLTIALSLAPVSLVALVPFGEWSLGRDAGVALIAFIVVSSVFILLSASRDQAEAAAHQARSRAEALAEATRAVADAELSLEGVLTAIAQQASVHVGELAVVRLVSANGACLETAAVAHPDPAAREVVNAALATECHPVDRGANGAALQEGRPLRLDATALKMYRAADPDLWSILTAPETAALLAVPLRAHRRSLGTLSVSRAHADRPYTEEDERFLQALADQATLAIERARVFTQIQADRERLRLALAANRMVVWDWNLATDAITTSTNFPEIFGLPALVGSAAGMALVHPDDLPAHEERVRRVAHAGGEYQSVFRITRPNDGQLVWLEERASALTDEAGRVTQLVGVVMDVTARLQAEESLRTSEARLGALLDQLPVGVGLTDDQGRWVLQNPALRGFVGETLPSHDPQHRARWQTWDGLGQPLPPLQWPGVRALQGDSVAGMDFLYTNPSGKEIWTKVSAAPFRNAAGAVIGVVNVIEDIDARRRSEEALRASETKVRRLFDTGVIGLIIADDERILEANDRFLQMVKATQDDLQGGRLLWANMTPPEYAERDAAAIAEITARGFCTPFEKEYVRLDGSRVPILIGAAAVQGTSPPWICAVLDLTTQKAVELDRFAFIDAATHDLRNPLTALKGRAQLLLRRLARGQATEVPTIETSLTAIVADADRMIALIDDLMDAAHLRIGQPLILDLAASDLVALAHDCVANVRHRTTQSITVASSVPELVGTWDLPRLERVVQNLLDNAIKYSFGNGDIALRIDCEIDLGGSAWAVLSVQDEGIGIPAADLPGIYERFQRGGNVGNTAGSGIGLAGAKQIIEQHGGVISVESVEGHGSTVMVRLPINSSR